MSADSHKPAMVVRSLGDNTEIDRIELTPPFAERVLYLHVTLDHPGKG